MKEILCPDCFDNDDNCGTCTNTGTLRILEPGEIAVKREDLEALLVDNYLSYSVKDKVTRLRQALKDQTDD